MPPTQVFSESLAHWRYAPDEWRDFVAFETERDEQLLRSYRNALIVGLSFALVVIALLFFIPLRLGYALNSNIWGAAFAVAVIAGVFPVSVGIYGRFLRRKLALFGAQPGDVYIKRDEVNINGSCFDWNYGGSGWHLQDVSRQTITTGTGRQMEVLLFNCKADDKGSRYTRNLSKSQRVPVPFGLEPEADQIVERLLLAAKYN